MTDYTPTRFSAELVSRLRGEIARHDVSQSDLAILCNVSQSQFSKIIRGVRPITLDQAAALAAALDLELPALVRSVELFLAERDNSLPSPVKFVEHGERLRQMKWLPTSETDAWAADARDRFAAVGGTQDDYELVARPTDPDNGEDQ